MWRHPVRRGPGRRKAPARPAVPPGGAWLAAILWLVVTTDGLLIAPWPSRPGGITCSARWARQVLPPAIEDGAVPPDLGDYRNPLVVLVPYAVPTVVQ
jgi:hypothetical protein